MKNSIILPIIVLFVGISCRSTPTRIENVLEQSGDNRHELEEVLHYFSFHAEDSLKYKAAVFLIENMPGHYTLESSFVNRFREELPDNYPDYPYHWYKTIQSLPDKIEPNNFGYKLYDLEWLKSSYLIRHIENSFRIWQTTPWLCDLPFDDFCEHLLPYRILNEQPDHFTDSILTNIARLKTTIQELPLNFTPDHITAIMGNIQPDYLELPNASVQLTPTQTYATGCIEQTLYQIYALQLAGIPAALDHVPCWGNRNGQHYWTSMISPTYVNHTRTTPIENAPKVYRRTFSHQPFPQSDGKEYIPEFFRTPFYKDVTHYYTNTTSVNIPLHDVPASCRYAYLCVFNDKQWHPVCWTETSRQVARFENIGRNIVYLPVCYQGTTLSAISHPFILHANGVTEQLIADTLHPQKIRLHRKYPIDNHKIEWTNLKGGYFEASNQPDFQNSTIIYRTDRLRTGKSIVAVDTTKAFRYWRYYLDGYHLMAEIEFYDTRGNKITGKTFLPHDPIIKKYPERLFDNDPLTYALIGPYIGMDFGKPVSLSEIHYLPRNDDNGITPGQVYELKYHNGRQWVSLGRQTASQLYIDFENVPTRALLWLQNLSTGREERIFTYENDRQRFW
ncbi:MAG: hypothetical protein NC410_11590 [Oscillibacter sp.]|nr:hypothetical protein [Oscillibacter sp.]